MKAAVKAEIVQVEELILDYAEAISNLSLKRKGLIEQSKAKVVHPTDPRARRRAMKAAPGQTITIVVND